MTQIFYRANLSDSQPPMVSTFQGKTVIQVGIDQNYSSGLFDQTEKDRGIPEALYMHNVIPSHYGYKSVAYDELVSGVGGDIEFDFIFSVKDFDGNRGHIAIAGDKTYMLTSLDPVWTDVTVFGQPSNVNVTAADATGYSFICYAGWNIFTVDILNKQLTTAVIQWDSPITNADMIGISSSNNYLLAHTSDTLYWSSALDVLDFRASQITGAGNGTPTAAKGSIVALAPVTIGFAIYCQGNIVVATYSGNVQYPWLFKEAPNGAGITDSKVISPIGDDGSNYAWTSSGILRVTLGGCTPVHSEVTDFLTGRLFEDYDVATESLHISAVNKSYKVKIAFIGSRYLVISYGINDLTHCFIYDQAFKRWGKLKIDHVQVFELSFDLSASLSYVTIESLDPLSYTELGDITYDDWIPVDPSRANEARHAIAFLQSDGTVKVANFDYVNYQSDAVLILGKYQVFRANTLAIQEFSLETIEEDNNDFSVAVLTSYDGKNFNAVVTPYEEVEQNMRSYKCLSIGQNHSIRIKGSFHLVGAVLVFTKNGNR